MTIKKRREIAALLDEATEKLNAAYRLIEAIDQDETGEAGEFEKARERWARELGGQYPTEFKGSQPPGRDEATCSPDWAEEA